ncbi:HAD-IA family hydrolase [Agromyces sp. H3Y2-19a]|uniref:HAD-IA family hydrolase n=1 Tax=Agromyces TaxID=33877 RepID=UPI001E52BB6B|nr:MULTISPECIES: HAD-IA family hydrolase [Agromyces]MCD5345654.1 HAD-IA family hydrolase [Agromyces sp. S2-1-8]MDF0512021.1 HAD-IA family hydrolase [Agromyces chromiiresistens]
MTTVIRASAVLLDMDGTLVDSTAVVERVWTDWAVEHGLDPADVLPVIHGRQAHASMAILLPARAVDENLADNRAMLERETTETEGVVAVAGAAGLLRALAGVPHALVTSATLALATARMAAAALPMPAIAVTAENVTESKPDPEGFLAAAAALGVAPHDCVVFEDSGAGITAAHRAGMRVVGVGQLAERHGADHLVADLSTVRVTVDGPTFTITLTQR